MKGLGEINSVLSGGLTCNDKVLGLHDSGKRMFKGSLQLCHLWGKEQAKEKEYCLCFCVCFFDCFTPTCVQNTKEYIPGSEGLFTAIPFSERHCYLRICV